MLGVEKLSRREYLDKISWIAVDGVSAMKGCHFRARRSFIMAELSEPRLYIAAESYYALYINGGMIGTGPARGTGGCNFLDEYDLRDFCGCEKISIGVEILCNNFPTFIASPAEPAIFVRVGDKITDNSWQVQIADDWHHDDIPNYTFQIGLMEWHDYRKTPSGWQMFQDGTEWQQAGVIDASHPIYAKKLFYRDIAPLDVKKILPQKIAGVYSVPAFYDATPDMIAEIMTKEEHRPLKIDMAILCAGKNVEIPPHAGGMGVAIIVDTQQAYIGGFELDISADAGTIIDVGNDEDFVDGRLTFKRHDYHMTDRYVHAGGRHIVSNPLHYRGGRYLQLVFRNFQSPITVHSLSFIDRRYPLAKTAEFECNDMAYNELWKRCVRTMSTCATDTFIDCPWREQAFWVNDFIVQSVYWFELTGNSELVRHSLDLAMSQRIEEGLIPGVCPFDGKRVHVLFATNLFLPIILRNYLRYTGDRKYVDTVLPTITEIFKCCQKYAGTDGLLNPPDEFWNFVDWGYLLQDPGLEVYPLNGKNTCVVNWFYVLACNALAELCADDSAAAKYGMHAKSITAAIEKTFWSDVAGMFYEWLGGVEGKGMLAGTLTHSLALLSGMLSSEKQTKVKVALQSGNLYHPELYMLHYVIETLAEIGEHSKVSDIIQKYWLPMLKSDTPTIWEANVYKHGKEALWGLGSMCHAFALSPVNYFQKYVLGIQPLADGFSKFTFLPNSLHLNNARGTVPTPHGMINVSWTRSGNLLKCRLDVPKNTVAILKDGENLLFGIHELTLST